MTDAMTDNRSQSDEAIRRNQETSLRNVPNFVLQSKESDCLLPQEARKLLQQPSTSTRKAMKVSLAEIEIALSKITSARPDLTENQILRMAGSTPQTLQAAKDKGEAPGYLLYALRGLDAQISPINQVHVFTFDELSALFDCVLHRQREFRKAGDIERALQLHPLLDQVFNMLQKV